MRGVVPSAILDRQDKVGFEPPQASWLATPAARALARELLLDGGARSRSLYDVEAVEQDLLAGRWRDHSAIWRAMSVELWLAACTRSPARTVAA